jgi:Protein of unknown function DUF2834
VETDEQLPSTQPVSRQALCVVYGVIAVAALIATWRQTVAYIHSPSDFFVNFWRDASVTPASRNITADILMFALAVAILMVVEARRHNVRFVWAYIAGGFFIAVSVTFPLFLIASEFRMDASEPPRLDAVDTILLALLAIALGALTIWVDMR